MNDLQIFHYEVEAGDRWDWRDAESAVWTAIYRPQEGWSWIHYDPQGSIFNEPLDAFNARPEMIRFRLAVALMR